jgi:hypothetical protein
MQKWNLISKIWLGMTLEQTKTSEMVTGSKDEGVAIDERG